MTKALFTAYKRKKQKKALREIHCFDEVTKSLFSEFLHANLEMNNLEMEQE